MPEARIGTDTRTFSSQGDGWMIFRNRREERRRARNGWTTPVETLRWHGTKRIRVELQEPWSPRENDDGLCAASVFTFPGTSDSATVEAQSGGDPRATGAAIIPHSLRSFTLHGPRILRVFETSIAMCRGIRLGCDAMDANLSKNEWASAGTCARHYNFPFIPLHPSGPDITPTISIHVHQKTSDYMTNGESIVGPPSLPAPLVIPMRPSWPARMQHELDICAVHESSSPAPPLIAIPPHSRRQPLRHVSVAIAVPPSISALHEGNVNIGSTEAPFSDTRSNRARIRVPRGQAKHPPHVLHSRRSKSPNLCDASVFIPTFGAYHQ
ncbi:hypothetical protein DFH09DRAFT_1081956 [Mycena vulgaris]|nr:hypothetical protein DFH09DRAFT_1081956 [Mycena vulgaris]